MESGASVMLLVLLVIVCGGGRPIGYESVSYDVVDVEPPSSEFNDFDYIDEDDFDPWVKPLHVSTRDIVGFRSCVGFICKWKQQSVTTTLAPQFFGPLEHVTLTIGSFTYFFPFNFVCTRNHPSSPGTPKWTKH